MSKKKTRSANPNEIARQREEFVWRVFNEREGALAKAYHERDSLRDQIAESIKLIAEHFTGPHAGLVDYVRNLLQAFISERNNCLILEGRLAEMEMRYRRKLWLGHGHKVLYGDDGEMQCGICLVDFKRAKIERLEGIIENLALQRLIGEVGLGD